MLEIPALIQGNPVKLQLHDSSIKILDAKTTSEYSLSQIQSIQVKNTEIYLLKLKMDDLSIILEFENMNVRDLAKSLLLNIITPSEELQKKLLDIQIDKKILFGNIKTIISGSQIFKTLKSDLNLYQKTINEDIYSSNILNAMTQPLIDIFISMNYTINQFFNLLTSSYFYDIKNTKNAIDRMLFERIRQFNGDIDYATRINSYSFMCSSNIDQKGFEIKEPKKKPVDFSPIYPFETKEEIINDSGYEIKFKELVCEFEPKIEKNKILMEFDQKDFEIARDLCKIAYSTDDLEIQKEIVEFTKNFREMIIGKYGTDAISYIERLMPDRYIKNK